MGPAGAGFVALRILPWCLHVTFGIDRIVIFPVGHKERQLQPPSRPVAGWRIRYLALVQSSFIWRF